MFTEALDTYPSAIQFFPDQYKTQKKCVKSVDNCLFVFHSVPDWYKTQEMCNKVVSKDLFMLKYCRVR